MLWNAVFHFALFEDVIEELFYLLHMLVYLEDG